MNDLDGKFDLFTYNGMLSEEHTFETVFWCLNEPFHIERTIS